MVINQTNGDKSDASLKVAESVADNSTIKKSELYDDSSDIIGFKIDIRCLYDLPYHETDICSMEVCLPSTDEAKFLGGISKLLREGRLNTTSLVPLCRRGANDKYTWICQICGLQAFFSTITYAGNDLFVAVSQFAIALPTCIDEVEDFEESIRHLLFFKDDIQAICESALPNDEYRSDISMRQRGTLVFFDGLRIQRGNANVEKRGQKLSLVQAGQSSIQHL
ncbi:hypothetical protein MBANPS3_006435 [Mucor bainieri]